MLSFLYRGLLDVYHLLARVVVAIFKLIFLMAKAIVWLVRKLMHGLLAIARPAMRFLAFILFIVSVIALVADLTPYLDHGEPMGATAVTNHWKSISPLSHIAAEANVKNFVGAWAWDTLNFAILNLPTFIVFGALGLFAAYLGRQRESIDVYVN